MPTKTVIFTALNKFSGTGMRDLLSHEYTQMAGRAGRRGIDTVGHVIHCNNLFRMPDINIYRAMLTGPPKMLISQFRISFNLILSIISAQGHSLAHQIDSELITFMEKSFIQNDITKEINTYVNIEKELEEKLRIIDLSLNDPNICRTPKQILEEYSDLNNKCSLTSNKQKKKLLRDIAAIESEHITIKDDIKYLNNFNDTINKQKENGGFKMNAINYIQTNIDNIVQILNLNNFLEYGFGLTNKGNVAMHIQEIHPLVVGDLYDKFDGFINTDIIQLIGLLSCFTNISMPSDLKSSVPIDMHINAEAKTMAKNLGLLIDKYYNIEYEYQLDTGAEYDIHFELIDYIIKWCNATNEMQCCEIINSIKIEKELFLGEFIKAILKINNIGKELEKICELLNNINLLQKVKTIPELTLKYVALKPITLYLTIISTLLVFCL